MKPDVLELLLAWHLLNYQACCHLPSKKLFQETWPVFWGIPHQLPGFQESITKRKKFLIFRLIKTRTKTNQQSLIKYFFLSIAQIF